MNAYVGLVVTAARAQFVNDRQWVHQFALLYHLMAMTRRWPPRLLIRYCRLINGGRRKVSCDVWGVTLHRLDLEVRRVAVLAVLTLHLGLWVSRAPTASRAGPQRSPILGYPSNYADTLCCRTIKFDTVTYRGDGRILWSATSVIPWERRFSAAKFSRFSCIFAQIL